MSNTWKAEISRTILNIFRPYNGIDVLKLQFLEALYEKTFVVPYVIITLVHSTNNRISEVTESEGDFILC